MPSPSACWPTRPRPRTWPRRCSCAPTSASRKYEATHASPGWLKTVTTHLCLNHLERYRARWRFFSEMGESGAPPFDAATEDAGPEAVLDESERHARLEQALRELPPHQRVPLVLFHMEGQGCDDIARLLGVSVGKVRTDMHRGRLALRRWLS